MVSLEVKWLHDVTALEGSRSFTPAAKARNISQFSFGRRIQSLEAPLGSGIFNRNASPLQLTDRGKIFVDCAWNMLDDMDLQISHIKGLNNTTQKIRTDAAPPLSVLLLPGIIAGYTDRKNKTFHVESIDIDDAVFNLKEGKNDFVLSFYNEELVNYPFISHKIFDSYLRLVSPCGEHGRLLFHLHRGVLPLMKYANDSCIGRQVSQVVDRTPEVTLSLTPVSPMNELLKRMILNDDGVSWPPQYSTQRELDEGRLTILDDRLSLPIGVQPYRSGSRLNQAVERFWQYIKTCSEPRE